MQPICKLYSGNDHIVHINMKRGMCIFKFDIIIYLIPNNKQDRVTMNQQQIIDNFSCQICTQIARNAVETFCCGQIMCQNCTNQLVKKDHKNCPNCRQQLQVRASSLARRVISTMKIPCQYQCGEKVPHKYLEQHERKCFNKIISCKICELKLKQKQLVQHMKESHVDKLYEMCLQYQVGPQLVVPSQSKISQVSISKIAQSKIVNSNGNTCLLGVTGKYYCGGRLIGKCRCCNGYCGPTNGQNCDNCMQADVKRLNLPKGCLVNPEGLVCQYDQSLKQHFCGRNMNGLLCVAGSLCKDCQKVKKSIQIGRYKNLI